MSQSHNDANATPYACRECATSYAPCCLGAAYGRRCSPGCKHAALVTAPTLPELLAKHRRNLWSQDSGKHCICGSDSRFIQWDGRDPAWDSMDEHRAQVVQQWIRDRLADERLWLQVDGAVDGAVNSALWVGNVTDAVLAVVAEVLGSDPAASSAPSAAYPSSPSPAPSTETTMPEPLTDAETETLLSNELAYDNMHTTWAQRWLFSTIEAILAARLAARDAEWRAKVETLAA